MKPSGTEHTAPGGAGSTHSMIRETCSRTGTLLSLKAVVMKQPKVSAAITLSEKANREFARDSTVFIVTAFLREPRLRHPHFKLRFPRPNSTSHPRTRCACPGSERLSPTPFPVLRRERARSHPLGHAHRAAVHALEGGALANSPISNGHEGWVLPRGTRLLHCSLLSGSLAW